MRLQSRLTLTALALALSFAACAPQVELPNEEPVEASVPVIAVAPDHGAPGDSVRIEASGFPPNEPVVVGIGPPQSEYEIVEQAFTDGIGRLSTMAAVPDWVATGEVYVWVVASPENTPRVISSSFSVDPGTTDVADGPDGN